MKQSAGRIRKRVQYLVICLFISVTVAQETRATNEPWGMMRTTETNIDLLVQQVRAGLAVEYDVGGTPKMLSVTAAYPKGDDGMAMHMFMEEADRVNAENSRRGKAYRDCWLAIDQLGRLRERSTSKFLMDVARSKTSEHLCFHAIDSVIRIGDTNMLEFVYELISGSLSQAAGYDCFRAYEQLSPYIGVCSWKPVPISDADRIEVDPAMRQAVLQFLMNAVTADPGFGSEYRADQTLCVASEEWRKSREREAFLERSKDTENTTYYADQLKALQAIPAAERTHVEVHPLRMASLAPPAPPQPASSTNATASAVSQPAP